MALSWQAFSDGRATQAREVPILERRLGRLASIDPHGRPHVVPLGWSYNQALDTIDIGGRDFAKTRKFRIARDNPKVTLVIDDVLPPCWSAACAYARRRVMRPYLVAGVHDHRATLGFRPRRSRWSRWLLSAAAWALPYSAHDLDRRRPDKPRPGETCWRPRQPTRGSTSK